MHQLRCIGVFAASAFLWIAVTRTATAADFPQGAFTRKTGAFVFELKFDGKGNFTVARHDVAEPLRGTYKVTGDEIVITYGKGSFAVYDKGPWTYKWTLEGDKLTFTERAEKNQSPRTLLTIDAWERKKEPGAVAGANPAAAKPAQDQPALALDSLRGTYTIKGAPAGGFSPVIKFDGKGKFTVTTPDGKEILEGTYKVTKDKIEFTDDKGPAAIKDAGPATYKWKLDGDVLRFTEGKDKNGHRAGLTTFPWERKYEAGAAADANPAEIHPDIAALIQVLEDADKSDNTKYAYIQEKFPDSEFATMKERYGPRAGPALPTFKQWWEKASLEPLQKGNLLAWAGLMGKPAVPFLMSHLKAEHRYIRAGAAVGLGRVGKDAREALDDLFELVQTLDPDSGDVTYQRETAIDGIGPDPEVYLEVMLKIVNKYLNDLAATPPRPDTGIRNVPTGRALYAFDRIGKLGPKAKTAVPVLIKGLSKYPHECSAAIVTLGNIGPDAAEAIPLLRKFLNHPASGAVAEEAIAKIKAKKK